jgi:hypothetical protein
MLSQEHRYPATVGVSFLLFLVVGSLVLHGQPIRAVPVLFAPPYRAATTVARAIDAACTPRGRNAAEGESAKSIDVLVAPIEDMNWEAVQYYLPASTNAGLPYVVSTPNSMMSSPSEIVSVAREADVVVTRSTNYEANGVPSNMLLSDLHAALLDDPEYRQLDTGLPADSYSVFVRTSACTSLP